MVIEGYADPFEVAAYLERHPNYKSPNDKPNWLVEDKRPEAPGMIDALKNGADWVAEHPADVLQFVLDVAGMAPVVGEPADLINGVISAIRGDPMGAALSASSAIPFWGWISGSAKTARRIDNIADAATGVAKLVDDKIDNVLDTLKTHGHHSDVKFLGGNPKQPLTKLEIPDHKELHRDLNEFLAVKTDEFGNHMRPQRGNPGAKIRRNFTRAERLAAEAEFYKKYGDKYPSAACDFFKQHPSLK